MATENDTWQSAVKELQQSVKELSELVKAQGSLLAAERARSASSSPSLAREVGASQAASESSETGNQHEPVRMTFEEFANESGLRF